MTQKNTREDREEDGTRWKHRYRHLDHRPDPVNVIPERLHSLGRVFFPIPPRRKGWSYPHGKEEYRYKADSKILNAYLEQGWNYGIACAEDLMVIDIDEPEYISNITSKLPKTMHQYTGSGESVHLFYRSHGINGGKSLSVEDGGEKVHVGDVKAHPRSYVVGPNSTHPTGNKYGPIAGDEMARIDAYDFQEALGGYISGSDDENTREYTQVELDQVDTHEFYELSADDVLPSLDAGTRTSHPIHGSSTGINFMKNEGGETFTCWRCNYGSSEGAGLNGTQYLAVEALDEVGSVTDGHCRYVRENWADNNKIHYYAWRKAVEKGLVSSDDPPFAVVAGFAEKQGHIQNASDLDYTNYRTMENALKYTLWYL